MAVLSLLFLPVIKRKKVCDIITKKFSYSSFSLSDLKKSEKTFVSRRKPIKPHFISIAYISVWITFSEFVVPFFIMILEQFVMKILKLE